MNKKMIAILDEDERYVTRLADYINKRDSIPLRAVPFTVPEMLEKYAAGHDAGILLANEDILDTHKGMADLFPVCIALTDRKEGNDGMNRNGSSDSGRGSGRMALYRYQPADRLTGLIVRQAGGAAASEEGCPARMIAVCSPIGRCGKTSLALALGFALSAKRRTLYVNLEDAHGFYELGACTAGKTDMSDLLYCFRTSPELFPQTLGETLGRWQDLDYLVPAHSCADLKEISAEEWQELFLKTAAAGRYETVILDLGTGLKALCGILKQCERVYIPGLRGRFSDAKVHQFLSELAEGGVNAARTVTLQVPCFRETGHFPEHLAQGEMAAFAERVLAG